MTSRIGWVLRLLFVVALLIPLAGSWLDLVAVPEVGFGTLVRLAGLGIVALVVGMLVLQKRRSRGQRVETDVEGSGDEYYRYAYDTGTEAAREGDRITEEAERLAEADRDANRRRDQNRR